MNEVTGQREERYPLDRERIQRALARYCTAMKTRDDMPMTDGARRRLAYEQLTEQCMVHVRPDILHSLYETADQIRSHFSMPMETIDKNTLVLEDDAEKSGDSDKFTAPVRVYFSAGKKVVNIVEGMMRAGVEYSHLKLRLPRSEGAYPLRNDAVVWSTRTHVELTSVLERLNVASRGGELLYPTDHPLGFRVSNLPNVYIGQVDTHETIRSFNGDAAHLFDRSVQAVAESRDISLTADVAPSLGLLAEELPDHIRNLAPLYGRSEIHPSFLVGEPIDDIIATINHATN